MNPEAGRERSRRYYAERREAVLAPASAKTALGEEARDLMFGLGYFGAGAPRGGRSRHPATSPQTLLLPTAMASCRLPDAWTSVSIGHGPLSVTRWAL